MNELYSAAVYNAVGARRCVVALGGGADSAMLLYAAVNSGTGAEVRAVFVHHGLASSGLLKQSAIELTSQIGVALSVVNAPVDDGADLEARARIARYAAIETTTAGDEVILTGHTADDQAETVLMRLLRGSGAGGLAGIPEVRGVWLRPFLKFRRHELRAAALGNGLPFVDDPANSDERFLRSRIRHQLLPELETDYAPGISSNLVRTARLARSDDDALTSLSDQIPITTAAGNIALPAPALLTAPEAVASRAVRTALRLFGDVYPGSMRDVAAAMDVARGGESAVISGNVLVRNEPPMIVFQAGEERRCDDPVIIRGASTFMWGQQTFSVHTERHPSAVRTAGRFSVIATDHPEGRLEARGVRKGDRLDIGTGSTPVAEVLRDFGVPPIYRPCWLLITIDGKIASIHGVRSAAWALPRNGDRIIIIKREVHS